MSDASGSTFPAAIPAAPKNATASLSVLSPWCVTVSMSTACPDFTRMTGSRSAAIQPQLTVSGVERNNIGFDFELALFIPSVPPSSLFFTASLLHHQHLAIGKHDRPAHLLPGMEPAHGGAIVGDLGAVLLEEKRVHRPGVAGLVIQDPHLPVKFHEPVDSANFAGLDHVRHFVRRALELRRVEEARQVGSGQHALRLLPQRRELAFGQSQVAQYRLAARRRAAGYPLHQRVELGAVTRRAAREQ